MEIEPELITASRIHPNDQGSLVWDPDLSADLLDRSPDGRSVTWDKTMARYTGKYPPAWVKACSQAYLHSGTYRVDFHVSDMQEAQIGLGFLLLWNVGPDWGFFGYLGASNSAWAYDPSTGDVVRDTRSIQGGLPVFADRQTGVVTLELEVPREAEGRARFRVNGVASQDIELPAGSVVVPGACLLCPGQTVRLEGHW